ncbi:efflux RND transporter permease subunit [Jannaschia donghaensis]|uniref:Multidrug resistance protein MdtF n=1 Tax=Jannaschia donghaensis TaxID=420998 RepID=A0A0M6YHE3_9RHOB|nr:efflux RND transporter permease subunit [Jannaschia donghaensis]CTQ49772.1 Multidrug resistance protein MdtF [Jannaschia donghaensis]
MGILGYFVRHRTAANLLLVLMLAAGAMAIPNMRAQFFPDVIVEDITVSVAWDGAGAEDVDRGVVQLLEPALLAVDGVADSSATSREGNASITLEFEPGIDVAAAADDVQAAIDGVSGLPEGIEDPEVRQGRWRDRVTDVIVTGPVGVDQLARIADEFVLKLFGEGVTRTSIRGVAAPEVVVEVPTANLIQYDLSMADIAEAIAAEAQADPAGDVTGANARVRTGTARRDAADIASIVMRRQTDGTALTIGEVGRVTAGGIDRDRAYFVGDDPAISVRVDRSAIGDAIALQRVVEEVAADIMRDAPEGTKIELIRTRTEAITGRISLLIDNALMGLALVVALLFLFLNARTAFWVAAGIPVAMLSAIALMWAAGITINMISLFALIITLGIVVDDAIVVGEHADFRHTRLGEDPKTAAENAARRMFTPVFSATLTTVIAFFGLVAIGGRFGDLIIDIPFTVIVVLIASLIECFLILPHHMAGALASRAPKGFSAARAVTGAAAALILFPVLTLVIAFALTLAAELLGVVDDALAIAFSVPFVAVGVAATWGLLAYHSVLAGPDAWPRMLARLSRHGIDIVSHTVTRGFDWTRETVFRPLVRLALWARYPVAASAVLLLATQVALLIGGDVQWRFFNSPERGSVTGNFAMVDGATREDTLAQMREMQRATEALGEDYAERYGTNPLAYVLAEIGGNSGRPLPSADDKDADQLGAISIELIDADLRPYSSFQFVGELQETAQQLPLTEEISFRGWRSGPGGDSLSVDFFGAGSATLKDAAEALKTAVAQFPEVSAVEDSLPFDKDELILNLTPQGEALGFDIDTLGTTLRNRLNGIEATTFPAGPRTGEIRVELAEGEVRADFLDTLRLAAPSGGDVALSDIVTVRVESGFATVQRDNGVQVVTVAGEISEDDPARANAIIEALSSDILPEIATRFQVAYSLGGLAEQEQEFLTDAALGLVACLLGIYLVLAWIFSSWTRPGAIMVVIPFGLIGAIWGHWWWEVPLSMFSVVGLIGMTGIIINDSIVLVTTVDEYAKDRALRPAIVDAVCDRLRPILLTTLTTVLGLAPLLYESSSQAQFLRPTVITLAYGLGFGMILVLLLVPAILLMGNDFARLVTALRRLLRLPLRSRGRGAGLIGLLLGTAIAVWGFATLGLHLITGAVWSPLAPLMPGDGTGAVLLAFLAGTLAVLVTVWLIVGLAMPRRRRLA